MSVLTRVDARPHGYFDYLAAILFGIAPFAFGFSSVPRVASLVVAGGILLLSLTTAYPLGAVKLIPFPLHGAIELAAGIACIAAPWALGFAAEGEAEIYFILAGVGVILLWLASDYGPSRPEHAPGELRRQGEGR